MQKKRAVFVVVAVYLLLQTIYISIVPDSDIDAYVHFIAARLLYINPFNLTAHWVWLPFYHYLLTGLITLGFSFQAVRFFNVAAWLTSSLVLYRMAQKKSDCSHSHVPLFALVFVLFMPTAVLSASSVEPEALFTLLIVSAVSLAEREKFVFSGLLLGIACIIRYEAWIIAAAFISLIFAKYKFSLNGVAKRRLFWLAFFPVIFLAGWFFARWLYQKETTPFVFGTKSFAETYTDVKPEYFPAWFQWIFDATFYIVYIPLLACGPFLYFAYRGLKSAVRQNRLLAGVSFSCLLFISFAWWFRYSLGLFRHFTVILPLLALCLAAGLDDYLCAVKNRIAAAAEERRVRLQARYNAGRIVLIVVFSVLLGAVLVIWKAHVTDFFSDRKQMAHELALLPDTAKILCSDNSVEIFSGKDMHQFTRLWADTSQYSEKMLIQYADTHPGGYMVIPADVSEYFRSALQKRTEQKFETSFAYRGQRLVLLQARQ